jgi:hypothetical protein
MLSEGDRLPDVRQYGALTCSEAPAHAGVDMMRGRLLLAAVLAGPRQPGVLAQPTGVSSCAR